MVDLTNLLNGFNGLNSTLAQTIGRRVIQVEDPKI